MTIVTMLTDSGKNMYDISTDNGRLLLKNDWAHLMVGAGEFDKLWFGGTEGRDYYYYFVIYKVLPTVKERIKTGDYAPAQNKDGLLWDNGDGGHSVGSIWLEEKIKC